MTGRVEHEWLELAADLLGSPPSMTAETRIAEQLTATFRARGTAYQHRVPGLGVEQRIWPFDEDFGGERSAISDWALHVAPTAHPLLRYYLATGSNSPMQVRDVPEHFADRRIRAEFDDCVGAWDMADQLSLPLHHSVHNLRSFVMARSDPFTAGELRLARTLHRLLIALDRHLGVVADRLVDDTPPEVVLTTREQAVLALVADGLTAAAVARRLLIAERTVHKHLQRIYTKLGVHDRLRAVLLAQQIGVLRAPPSVRSSGP